MEIGSLDVVSNGTFFFCPTADTYLLGCVMNNSWNTIPEGFSWSVIYATHTVNCQLNGSIAHDCSQAFYENSFHDRKRNMPVEKKIYLDLTYILPSMKNIHANHRWFQVQSILFLSVTVMLFLCEHVKSLEAFRLVEWNIWSSSSSCYEDSNLPAECNIGMNWKNWSKDDYNMN